MKKFLLSLALIATISFTAKVNAQCAISDVTITPTNVDLSNCVVTFNLSFTLDVNNGSKHVVAHIWQNYPSPAYTQYPLQSSQTNDMIGTIVIKDPYSASPQFLNFWPTGANGFPNGTTPNSPILTGQFSAVTNANGTRTFSFTGVNATLANCNQAVGIIGDVWATQNNNNSSCLLPQGINVIANEPGMRGSMSCQTPRTFNISFNTTNETEITFSAYKDANNNGTFDEADVSAGKLTLSGPGSSGSDVTVTSPAKPINVYDGTNTFGPYTFAPQPAGSQYEVFIVAKAGANTYNNVLLINNSCAPLPVAFKSFTAVRNNSKVALKWETASEINNKGFNVQRNTKGTWETLAFVSSQATNGNSENVLSYSFNDVNTNRGVSQYRIQQVDFDSKSKYSDIRAIRGEEQSGRTIVYPNPAVDGKVNVIFEDQFIKNVVVTDMSGRILKRFNNVINNISIDNLETGLYNIQITDLSTAVTTVEKVIIKKR